MSLYLRRRKDRKESFLPTGIRWLVVSKRGCIAAILAALSTTFLLGVSSGIVITRLTSIKECIGAVLGLVIFLVLCAIYCLVQD